MASGAEAGGVAGLTTMAAILAAQPFGLQVNDIVIGSAFAALGVIGKSAWELQTALEHQDPIRLSRVLGWVGAGLIGAPFTTVVWLIMLKMISVPADNVAIMGLTFMGFLGPKGVSWLIERIPGTLPKGLLPPEGSKANEHSQHE